MIVEDGIAVVMSALMSRSGPRSAMLVLKHKFLRTITNLLASAPKILDIMADDIYQDYFKLVFTSSIPCFLVYRPVVLQTIKSVKEIAADAGALRTLETSFLKEEWFGFAQLILERAIFIAIYARDCTEETRYENRCYNVSTLFPWKLLSSC